MNVFHCSSEMKLLALLLFVSALGVAAQIPSSSTTTQVNQSITIARTVYIPSYIAVLESVVVCPDCSSYVQAPVVIPPGAVSTLGAGMHIMNKNKQRSSAGAVKAPESGKKKIDTGFVNCHNGVCRDIKQTTRTPSPDATHCFLFL